MPAANTDELIHKDRIFFGNRLLATFDAATRALIEPFGEVVDLKPNEVVLARGEQVECSIFPVGQTTVSLAVRLADGRSVEVASIGREGAVGGIVSCGHAPAFSRASVLIDGPAFRVPMRALEAAKRQSTFIDNLFCRYSDYLLSQVMQSAACNAHHTIAQRAARWLLHAKDRAGDRIELTQEALAGLLGVQRTTVNSVVRAFQEQRLLRVGRGVITITDPAGLSREACECYGAIEAHFGAVIGASGAGGD